MCSCGQVNQHAARCHALEAGIIRDDGGCLRLVPFRGFGLLLVFQVVGFWWRLGGFILAHWITPYNLPKLPAEHPPHHEVVPDPDRGKAQMGCFHAIVTVGLRQCYRCVNRYSVICWYVSPGRRVICGKWL